MSKQQPMCDQEPWNNIRHRCCCVFHNGDDPPISECDYHRTLRTDNDRLRAECLRLSHAEAEAMAVVLSQEGQIERLRVEHLSNINLAISYLAQVAGMLNDGDIDKAQEFCYAAAESWTQNIAELEVVENRSAALAGAADQPSEPLTHICYFCHARVIDGTAYCGHCGTKQPVTADPTNGATE
jgi:hypothetical protein